MAIKTLLDHFESIPDNTPGKTDKGTVHDYIKGWYSDEFTPKKKDKLNILEIGVSKGDSLILFRDWFINSKLIGIDNLQQQTSNEIEFIKNIENVELILQNAYSEDVVNMFEDEYFDYIIDDGPHTLESQIFSVKYYYQKLKLGGKLIIEDVNEFEYRKNYFDELNILYDIIDLRPNKDRFDDVLLIFKR
jgi:hypothetical protein